jgi:hypothetical protein
MATNKKITQLDELTPATWADDDVIAIVDISAQETKKIQLSTFRGAVAGVSSLNASTPLTVDSATGDVTISVAINGGGTINAVFDEDNMASNSPTALATQQSIKAYVDSQVGTVDTLAEILANGNTSGGTNIVVSSGDVITTNTINETTAASGVTIDGVLVKDGEVDGRDVSVDGTKLDTIETNADVTDTANVTAAGALMDSELTNIAAVKALNQGVATTDSPSFAGLTATTADINGGTIDGTVIGGSSAASGTFTTFTSTGIDDNATSTALTISSADNVGVGTATPDRLFEVDEASGDAYIRLRASDTGGGADTIFENLCADNAQNNYIYFGDLDDVDIGTIRYSHASDFMSFTTNASERMRITSTGRVGIGTTNPGGDLHIQGAVGSQANLYLTDGDATGVANSLLISKSGSASFVSDRQAGSSLSFGTADTERMRIDSSGNVGIGTASPASTLTVSDGTDSGMTPFGGTDLFLNSSGDNYLQFGSGSSSSPAIYFGDSADGDVGGIIYSHATDAMSFRTNAAERMRIDSSGNTLLSDNELQRAILVDYGEKVNAIGSIGGGTQDIDLTLGNVVTGTVDTSTTTFTFSNPTGTGNNCGFTLYLTNGGSQTVNWPASVDWPGATAPTLTAAGKDILVFQTTDGGTTWYGNLVSANYG